MRLAKRQTATTNLRGVEKQKIINFKKVTDSGKKEIQNFL